MKINFDIIPMLNLQLFAEGGAAGGTGGDGGTAQGQGVTGAAAVPRTKGAKNNPLAAVKYGIQEDAAPAAEVQTEPTEAPDLNAEFEQLIKGKFKTQYDARMQDTIRNRLKGKDSQITELTEKQNAVTPILELLGKKYGVDATDIKALDKAIQDDDSYFEEEALEKNLSVQQLKEIRKMERENADLKKKMQEQQIQENANKLYAVWMVQAEEAKKVYPSLDLRAEMQNKAFKDILNAHVDVKTAYEIVHKDELIPAAMQFAVKTAESKLAKKIAAQGARPAENGMSSGSPAVVKSDVSQLTRKDIAEVSRRVARGERISFG